MYQTIIQFGVKEEQNAQLQQALVNTNIAMLTGSVVALFWIAYDAAIGDLIPLAVASTTVPFCALYFLLMYMHRVTAARYWIVVGSILITINAQYLMGPQIGAEFPLITVIAIMFICFTREEFNSKVFLCILLAVAFIGGGTIPKAFFPEHTGMYKGAGMLVFRSLLVTGTFVVLFILFIVVFRDLKKQGERLKNQEHLQQQAIIEYQKSLFAGIAHEMNSPLAILNISIETLPEADGAKVLLLRKMIEQNIKRLQLINNHLKRLTFVAENHYSSSLRTAVENCIRILETRISSSQVHLKVNTMKDFHLQIAPQYLVEILTVLVNNAIDAVSTTEVKQIEIGWKKDAKGMIALTIIDSGMGIPAAIQAKIFQPFFTTKKLGRTLANGLSSVRATLTVHGGRLELVESRPGHTAIRAEIPEAIANEALHPINNPSCCRVDILPPLKISTR